MHTLLTFAIVLLILRISSRMKMFIERRYCVFLRKNKRYLDFKIFILKNHVLMSQSLFCTLDWCRNLKFTWSWWFQKCYVLLYIKYQTWCLYFVSWHGKMKPKKKCDMMGAKFIIQKWNMSMKQAHVCYVK